MKNTVVYDKATREFTFGNDSCALKLKIPTWISVRELPQSGFLDAIKGFGCALDYIDKDLHYSVPFFWTEEQIILNRFDVIHHRLMDRIFILACKRIEHESGKSGDEEVIEEAIVGVPNTVRAIPFRYTREFKLRLNELLES